MTATIATPQRTCVGCRTTRSQTTLVRVVVAPDGTLIAGRNAPGRGAWLCNLSPACLELAKKRRGFERAFRMSFEDGALDGLMTAATSDQRAPAWPENADGEQA